MPHPKSSFEFTITAGETGVIGAPPFDLAHYMHERAGLIEHQLAISIAEFNGPANRLIEAMRYSLMAGGKRLRPILALAACESVGGKAEAALGYACALEMIHTYSLVHDDLPCMDDDDLRRGRPTNHKVFGEAIAMLAGDGLLTDAFGLIARSAKAAGISAEVIIDTIAELADACGSSGMVGGQVLDLLAEGQPLTQQELEHLHSKKTGALFVASVCGGARLGGAGPLQLQSLRNYAGALGLAFQVTDDLLDVEETTEHLGKRSHKDHKRGKATYPSIIGVERSRALAHELAHHAREELAGFDSRAEPLRMLADFAVERNL
ncbi:MAG: polyprenyl synthetase family protein [Deltaproteobacteria bacterium]|nr:polyprenyl synthetase family protein [Deltaproteobacteria bacterium]MBV8453633.1 polyprenyl synthetase family protein [Deltaproteobacteria bacterium]